jgi:hypothetical protein
MATHRKLLALGILLATSQISSLEAQRPGSARVRATPEVGLRLGRDFSVDSWTAGAHIRVPLGGTLELRPSGDLSLDSPGDDYQLNADLAIRGPRDQAYIGAGAGWVHRDFDSGKESATGINVFLGFKPFPRPGSQLYLEGRWTRVDSESVFRIGLGVAFSL